ncbi:MAG TPA: HAMP domain-containing sensor histidine kinase [Chloroflexota bacterium]|nr:HAMP domain-containing sensor histidine kinase [Chloroflexota bacterium]
MSLRLRLTLLNSLILLLVGGALVTAVYTILAQGLERQIDDSLREQARLYGATAGVVFNRGPNRPPRLVLPIPRRFAGSHSFVQVAERDGEVRARSENLGEDTLPLSPEALRSALAGQEWLEDVEVDGQPLRQLVAPLRISRGPDEAPTIAVIQVARPLGPLHQTLGTLKATVLGVGAAGVLAALVAGWLLARAALRPIDELANTADAIGAARDFGRRVPLHDARRDEIGRLAEAFNRMLGELQAAHEQLGAALAAQRRFVGDASHELRTPLATLRGNVELLRHMSAASPPGDDRQAAILDDLAAEAGRMGRLVADLLLLAQADAGQHLTLRPLDLAEVARDAARAARLLRDGATLEVADLTDGLWVSGHEDRLRQVLVILLDNALKFTPPGGWVTLAAERLRRSDVDWISVRVADTGPGIPPADQARIFDRFYRGAAARSVEGTGLGLAIARWIVEEHRGTIEVASPPGEGTVFTLRLPAAPAPLALPAPRASAAPLAAS